MRTRLLSALALLALLAPLATSVRAASLAISDIVFTDRGAPAEALDEGSRLREFRSEATTTSVAAGGDAASFAHRHAWLSAQRILPGGGIILPSHARPVAYDLAFTVEDPLARGYSLAIDSTLRGYLTAHWQGNEGGFTPNVFAAGTALVTTLDSGEGFGSMIEAISPQGDVVTATPANPHSNLLVEARGRHDAGRFVGTRAFVLRFAAPTANTSAALQNLNLGEAAVRFGLEPSLAGFGSATYPGPDGEAAALHGHFVTVTAQVAPVPLPAAAWLLAGALAPLAFRARRRRLPLASPVR